MGSTSALEKELLEGELDALVAELDAERYRHVAGLEPTPSLTAVFNAHSRAAHKETVKRLEAAGEKELASKVASLRAERAQAEDEECWRAVEAASSVLGPDGPVPLAQAHLAVTRERNRERRQAFGQAAVSSPHPSREGAAEKRARARAEMGLQPDWKRVEQADGLLAASDDAYRDVLGWLARREAGLSPLPRGDLSRSDLLFVLALRGWEPFFPRGMLAVVLERTCAVLDLNLGSIRIDEADRAAQWPGAHARGARVAFRRQGGAADWLGLFDAVGRALGAAAVAPHRLHLAAPSTFGSILSGLLLDGRFLSERLDVEKKCVADLRRALALRGLFRLRAQGAACRVAAEVEQGSSGSSWREAHREAMARSLLAVWPGGLAPRDADGASIVAQLQGAARAAQVRRALVERCDEDWWKNPRSAAELGSLLAGGGAWPDEDPPLTLGVQPLLEVLQ